MPRWAAKVDGNQARIKDLLEHYGWSCVSTATIGNGFPDLVIAKGGRTVLVEVKVEKGRVRASQEAFLKHWPGECLVMRSIDDVIAFVKCRSGQGVSQPSGAPGSPGANP